MPRRAVRATLNPKLSVGVSEGEEQNRKGINRTSGLTDDERRLEGKRVGELGEAADEEELHVSAGAP
jgi:hypothetical protein